MSFTQHEANNNLVWISDKTLQSLSDEEKACVEEVAAMIGAQEPAHALQLETDSAQKLRDIGVLIVDDVDKAGFIAAAQPIQDQLAAELGPNAVEVVEVIRSLK
jgi:TRAP-type C4-dicarboxylate transport system substrate-binding protein